MLVNEKELQLHVNTLEDISGGQSIQVMRIACKKCHNPFYANVAKSTAKCPICGEQHTFAG